MKAAVIEQEELRLALLRGYTILDTAPEESFDEIVTLASEICNVPVALISFVETDRQWFKAKVGLDVDHTPISSSICMHAIASEGYLEIPDLSKDPRTAENPLVTEDEKMRFYAGVLLRDEEGVPVGTLCVLDRKPNALTPLQKRSLEVLSKQVMHQLNLRQALASAEVLRKEVDHRVKNSLQSLAALVRIQARGEKSEEAKAALEAVQGRLAMISTLHEALYLTDAGAVVNIAPFLGRVLSAAQVQMPSGVSVLHDIAPCDVESRAASAIGMIVNEAITNAAKYAFVDRETGSFQLVGAEEDGTYSLTCSDDGQGADALRHSDGTGLGMRIMEASAQQIGGELAVNSDEDGYRITLSWTVS